MAFPDNSVMELRIVYEVNSQVCMNVTHWDPDGNGAGFGTVLDLEQEFVEFIAGQGENGLFKEMRDIAGQNVTFIQIIGQIIWPTRYRAYVLDIASEGLVAVDCEAQNLQASIEKYGELANRHNIGAFHMGGLPSDSYDNGELKVATLVQLAKIATALKTEVGPMIPSGLRYAPVILNKEKTVVDGKDHFEITGKTLVIDTVPKTGLRCMSRRTLGHGI